MFPWIVEETPEAISKEDVTFKIGEPL